MKIKNLIYIAFLVAIIVKYPIFDFNAFGYKFEYKLENLNDSEKIIKRLDFFRFPYKIENKENLVIFYPFKLPEEVFSKCDIKIYFQKEISSEDIKINIGGKIFNYSNETTFYDGIRVWVYENKINFEVLNSSFLDKIDFIQSVYDRRTKEHIAIGTILSKIDMESQINKVIENFEVTIQNVRVGNVVYELDGSVVGFKSINEVIDPTKKELIFIVSNVKKSKFDEDLKKVKMCSFSGKTEGNFEKVYEKFEIGNMFYFYIVLFALILVAPILLKRRDIYKEVLIIFFLVSLTRIINEIQGFFVILISIQSLLFILAYIIVRARTKIFEKQIYLLLLIATILTIIVQTNQIGILLFFSILSLGIKSFFEKL